MRLVSASTVLGSANGGALGANVAGCGTSRALRSRTAQDPRQCHDGGCALIRQCVQASLGHADTDRNVDTRWTQMLAHSRT